MTGAGSLVRRGARLAGGWVAGVVLLSAVGLPCGGRRSEDCLCHGFGEAHFCRSPIAVLAGVVGCLAGSMLCWLELLASAFQLDVTYDRCTPCSTLTAGPSSR